MSERLCATEIELEVPFHDVDALGVVWHGHYFKYFEHARTKLLRGIGLDGGDLIGPRFRFLVIETRCRHAAPLRYGERFVVHAWLRDVRHRLNLAFEIRSHESGRRIARGHVILATLGRDGRLLLETPDEILRRIHA